MNSLLTVWLVALVAIATFSCARGASQADPVAISPRYYTVLLDSIAAAYVGPFLGSALPPVVAILHQPPGGIDHGGGLMDGPGGGDAKRDAVGFGSGLAA